MEIDFSRKNARRQAGAIYIAAQSTGYCSEIEIVEHILRAVLEVLTPEQRAQILDKVK